MENSIENLNRTAVNNGLILGAITFCINVVVYYAYPSAMGSTSFGILSLIVALILYIYFIIDLRKKIGGFWSFKEALKGIFLMTIVSALLGAVLQFIFYKFIEPNAYDKISGYVLNSLTETYSKLGMDQDTIDKTVEKINESLKSQFNPSIGDFFKTLGISVVIQFILSLIFAAIFKKEQPLFAKDIVEE